MPAEEQIERDAERVYAAVMGGGIAIIHLDVAYAVVARTEAAVKRFYAAKGRSFAKPTGIVGCMEIHEALHDIDARGREIVRAVTVEHDLPLAVIAPFRRDHPFLADIEPFVLANANKDGTLNLLLNAGRLRDRIARLSWQRSTPLVGSSANVSLTGSKYRVEDIEPELMAIADVVIDYGESKFRNPEGRSSTMIDFRDFSIVRRGVCFDAIARLLHDRFGVTLKDRPRD